MPFSWTSHLARLIVALLLVSSLGVSSFAIAQESEPEVLSEEFVVEDDSPIPDEDEIEEAFDSLTSSAIRNAYILLKLKQYLVRSEEYYDSLQGKMEDAREGIESSRHTISTLEGQVSHLESLYSETEHKISNVEVQIQQKESDIEDMLERIKFSEIQIEEQKRALEEYFKLLYFEKNLSFSSENEINPLKVLLQAGTVSSVLQEGTYLSLLEQQTQGLIGNLEILERSILQQNHDLTFKREQLDELSDRLDGEYRNLQAQLEGKQNLLRETQGNDEIYRELFASYKRAQEGILEEINLFQNNIELMDRQIFTLSSDLSDSDIEKIEQIKSDSTGELGFSIVDAADFLRLEWPVSPSQGLTAFYSDQDYVGAFGVPHHALDIRVPHGSIIYAPADGYVHIVHDAATFQDEDERMGYGYLTIAHRKGTMSLYGHLSASLVHEGDFVQRGQIIGLTGGTPGMPGSGARTTGAHLHMEVLQNGVRVDPLLFLPLKDVPFSSLPEDYLLQLQAELEQDLAEEQIFSEDLMELEEELINIEDIIEFETIEDAVDAQILQEFSEEELIIFEEETRETIDTTLIQFELDSEEPLNDNEEEEEDNGSHFWSNGQD
jgi:murein DD-endopeptidase MepM/ murein hydrolase activator NlpD